MRIGRHEKPAKKKQAKPEPKPQPEKIPAANGSLLKIYERALEKVQAGDFDLVIFDEDFCAENGTDARDDEEEVENWMLARMMMQRKDKRYKSFIKYIKSPKGIQFKTTDFGWKDIVLFVSPQTAQTHGDNQ